MTTARPPRVAILGARGIGRHHARWWHLAGAQVCAHLGTSAASVDEARQKLAALFPYAGRGYTDLDSLLATERPDWVDVATADESHAALVRAALLAGAHVLCEKPFCHAPGRSAAMLLAETDALLTLARERGRTLALCSQYGVAASRCLALRAAAGAAPPRALRMTLASPTRGRAPDPLGVWIDLGPHLVAALQTVVAAQAGPAAEVVPEVTARSFAGYRVAVTCRLTLPDGTPFTAELIADRTQGEPANVRQITLDDALFDLQGENDMSGIFRSRVVWPGGIWRGDDPMHQLIAETLAGRAPLQGAAIRRNEEWLLRFAGLTG
jgi:predicted dehydrogenase